MNNIKRKITLFTSLFIFSLSCSCCNNNSVKSSFSQDDENNSELYPAFITNVEIPEKVIFADETIDFSRYDMRERLDRELINFCNMHTNTTLIIKRANRYLPEIEQILKEEFQIKKFHERQSFLRCVNQLISEQCNYLQ